MQIAIENLHASIEGKPILRGINLTMSSGEVHALMGPNGSGKSTLSNVIMGHPSYEVTAGTIDVDGTNVLELEVHERARLGVFLAFQYPVEVPGVTVGRFLKRAVEIRHGAGDAASFVRKLREMVDFMEMDRGFINRYLNDGFSGGEKKRMEVLQMLMLNPSFAVLDETDSGLDIDALKIVARGVNRLRSDSFGALVITHYQRILSHILPDRVHIMFEGRVVKSGGPELVAVLEEHGYDWIREEFGGKDLPEGGNG